MAVPPPVRKLRPSTDQAPGYKTRTLAAASSGLDVCAQDATGRPCRAIKVNGAGTMTVEHPGDYDSAGSQVQVTWTCLAGDYLPVSISKIVASGTATNIILIW